MAEPLSYEAAGVRYDVMDPFKRACQQLAATTSGGLAKFGMKEVEGTRGESAYVIETDHGYLAHVEEALGTKTLVADAMYKLTGKSFYRNSAIDDVSTIVNDLCVCGALPVTVAMYAAVGDSAYLGDEVRARDLAEGFAEGCRMSGAAWSGGETQTLKGMVNPETVILGGSAVGRIAPKSLRILGDVVPGDEMIFLASSGVQTNGLTLCRVVADRLQKGYLTKLSDGRTYGEALLAPSVIYVPMIAACQQAGIKVKYAVHMTGHGWRKLMRLEKDLVYRVEDVGNGGRVPEIFDVIMKGAGMGAREAYGTFNMGVGFAVMVAKADMERTLAVARGAGFVAWRGGSVVEGYKAVEILPLGFGYMGAELGVR